MQNDPILSTIDEVINLLSDGFFRESLRQYREDAERGVLADADRAYVEALVRDLKNSGIRSEASSDDSNVICEDEDQPASSRLVDAERLVFKDAETWALANGDEKTTRFPSAIQLLLHDLDVAKHWRPRHGARTKDLREDCKDRVSFFITASRLFMHRLDEALHYAAFHDEKIIWQHRNFNYIAAKKPGALAHFIDDIGLRELATEYLERPWLQGAYLDWVLVDALLSKWIADLLSDYLPIRYGIAWEFFGRNLTKVAIWRATVVPLWAAAEWLAPLGMCWLGWTLEPKAGLWPLLIFGTATFLWFTFKIWLFARWAFARLSLMISGQPTPMRRLEALLSDLKAAYSLCGIDIIHVPSLRTALERATASSSGFFVDQHVMCILDNVEKRGVLWARPRPWI